MMQVSLDERLHTLGLAMPSTPKPAGSYKSCVLAGDLLFVSGVTPKRDGILVYKGRIGEQFTVEDGMQAARLCALNLLSVVKSALGGWNEIVQFVKLTGYICSSPDFTQHPKVMDGASTLLAELFGEQGAHARCAVGVASLPGGACVEIDAIVQIRK